MRVRVRAVGGEVESAIPEGEGEGEGEGGGRGGGICNP